MRAARQERETTRGPSTGFSLIEMLVVIVLVGILGMAAMTTMSSSSDRAYRSAMISDLRSVAVEQEAFNEQQFIDTGVGRYARNAGELGINLSNGVRLRMRGNRNGWSARATHSRVSGMRCAIYRGNIRAFPPATEEGQIACD